MSWSQEVIRLSSVLSFLPFLVSNLVFVFNLSLGSNIKTHCKVNNVLQTLSNTATLYDWIEYAWQLASVVSVVPKTLIGLCLIEFYQRRLQHCDKEFELKVCYVLTVIVEPLFSSIALANLDVYNLLHYALLLGSGAIHAVLMIIFTTFERQCKIKNKREKTIFNQRCILVHIMVALLPVTGILLLIHVYWCIPYSYSLFSLMEYLILFLFGVYLKLTCDLVYHEKNIPQKNLKLKEF